MTLEVDGLTHRYGDEPAVDDVSLSAAEGELLALLGPSGCGKTTVVQTVAGHLQPTGGRVRLRGTDVTDNPPETRRVGLVFQEPTLYPHMTVGENVAYGLKARGVGPEQRAATVDEYLGLVGLGDRCDSSPPELSGGQRRRVELARALAPEPDVLLLDEPLSALDRQLRTELREEVARIQRETGVTTLYVTHDQETAMALADRLVVMNDGRVSGTGDPRTLYESPPTPFVASFLGRSNALPGTVVGRQPLRVEVGGAELAVEGAGGDHPTGSEVTCHVRPEALSLRSPGRDGPEPAGRGPPGRSPDVPAPSPEGVATARSLQGEVERVADLGKRYDVTVRLDAGETVLVECRERPPTVGNRTAVEVAGGAVTVFRRGADGVMRAAE
jgi:ABC-type Fe3+/spermidine/putrescine transport system ATPase subunit